MEATLKERKNYTWNFVSAEKWEPCKFSGPPGRCPVVIQFEESWCPTACTSSPSTDSILGLLLTPYTIWVGWP